MRAIRRKLQRALLPVWMFRVALRQERGRRDLFGGAPDWVIRLCTRERVHWLRAGCEDHQFMAMLEAAYEERARRMSRSRWLRLKSATELSPGGPHG